MDVTSSEKNFDRSEELKAFDESKAGVKGLVDGGASKVPRIFIRPPDELAVDANCEGTRLEVPTIDLSGINDRDRRREIVYEIKNASEKWGFFQVVNHGVAVGLMGDMIDGTRRFHEQDREIKKELYSRDIMKKVRYYSNFDLFKSKSADWRDTLTVNLMRSYHVDPQEIPQVCRDVAVEYIKEVTKLGETLFELLSEALGLNPDHLNGQTLEVGKGCSLQCNYYPGCPEPRLTMGITRHTDAAFLNILLQDNTGGLQVLHDKQWVDVQPVVGSFIVNVGDILQVLTNGKFFSAEHRALANRAGPRISVSCFFTGIVEPKKIYGPIEALISEENPRGYTDFALVDFEKNYYAKSSLDISANDAFKL